MASMWRGNRTTMKQVLPIIGIALLVYGVVTVMRPPEDD